METNSKINQSLENTSSTDCKFSPPPSSRIEIAIRIMQGWASNPGFEIMGENNLKGAVSNAYSVADEIIRQNKSDLPDELN